MSKGIFIIGTDTEVGKTVVSAGLMYLLLKKRHNAVYFKPVASGEIEVNGLSVSGDAAFVKNVSGLVEEQKHITPYSFKNAVAPHFSARQEKKPINIAVIKETFHYLKEKYELIVAEGAGGLAVPLNDEGYMQYHFIHDLGFPCLLVARTGLGTINHTLLTLRFAQSHGLKIKGLIMSGSHSTPMEIENIKTVRKLAGVPSFFILPAVNGVDTEKLQAGNLHEVFESSIDIDQIIGLMENI